MHILIYKLKDSSLGRLVVFVLVFALFVPLVTHYYLGKHTVPSERTPMDHFQTRSKLDRPAGKFDLLLDNIDDLKYQVDELQRIKLSLTNELRELEGKKNRLLTDISTFTKKADGTRIQAEHYHSDVVRAKRELELIKLAKVRANDCPELPQLKLPQRLTVPSESEVSPLPDQRILSNCQLRNCFDFSRCSFDSGFPVYVYERPLGQRMFDSDTMIISQLLKESHYFISEPVKACLYIVIVGLTEEILTRKSNSEFQSDLYSLPYWGGNGRNHLILYLTIKASNHSSNFPSSDINTGLALIAQSTFPDGVNFRPGFDIVLPPSNGPPKGDAWSRASLQLPARRKYLLSFQAMHTDHVTKAMAVLRDQLNELSQEARDLFMELYLLKPGSFNSNEEGEWLLWGSHENRTKVLHQSTFTLIAGSHGKHSNWDNCHIRLLEALQCGAIPVVLSSRTVLPFNDMIDWHKAVIIVAPARVPELNVLLRTITNEDILQLRWQGRFLWETYLSTTNAILKTMLATIRTRLSIPAHPVPSSPTSSVFSDARIPVTSSPDPDAVIGLPLESPAFVRNFTTTVVDRYNFWNSPPGSFQMYPSSPFDPVFPSSAPFRNSSKGFELIGEGAGGAGVEFSKALGGNYPVEQFTVVILTYQRELVLIESIQRLVGLQYLNKVVVVWNSPEPPSLSLRWPDIGVPVHVSSVACYIFIDVDRRYKLTCITCMITYS